MTDLRREAEALWDALEGARPYVGPLKDLPVEAIIEAFKAQRVKEVEKCMERLREYKPSTRWYFDGWCDEAVEVLSQRKKELQP